MAMRVAPQAPTRRSDATIPAERPRGSAAAFPARTVVAARGNGIASAALEHEADAMGDRAMRLPPPAGVMRPPGHSGAPLPAAMRAWAEPRFGHDFSGVRTHFDGAAAARAHALRARAYTVGRDIVFGAGEYAPATAAGQRLLAHELAHVVQQAAGPPVLQRKPVAGAGHEAVDEPAPLFTMFVSDERHRTDQRFARRLGRADAARLRKRAMLSTEDRQELNGKLKFFEGEAKAAYGAEIRPVLVQLTAPEIEMPAVYAGRDRPVAGPKPTTLLSMDYSDPAVCGGARCVSDEDIDAPLARSRAEDRQAEARAIAARAEDAATRRIMLATLQAEAERTQRGTRAHRYALERLETYRDTGHDPGPHRNYEGGPAPVNWTLGALGGLILGGLAAEGVVAALATSEIPAALTYTAGRATQAVLTRPALYLGAAVAYGAVAPPGAPDLPGPWDDAGKSLKALGVAANDVEVFAKGGKVWGDIARGNAKLLPYFETSAGRVTAGVLSANWHGDQAGIIRAFVVFRQQSMLLARQLGAKTLRLEADVVTNTEELLPNLLKMGFKPSPDKPATYFLDLPVN